MAATRILVGDCVDLMADMPDASVDAIVTDPPYGLEFMGKEWDALGKSGVQRKAEVGGGDRRAIVDAEEWGGGESSPYSRSRVRWQHGEAGPAAMQDWHHRWATQALRVLKPGGHLLAFGGTRTYHRLACAIEDAGFEIRDTICWLYGSGFPKSLNLNGDWQGWGTALKPAHEPIVVARKPLAGTVAGNVLEHGTGALNVDGCRVETTDELSLHGRKSTDNGWDVRWSQGQEQGQTPGQALGRWPANVLLDEEAAGMLDGQTGVLVSGPESDKGHRRNADALARRNAYGGFQGQTATGVLYGDSGGASRFFLSVSPDTLCVLCGLPCVEVADNPSLRSILSNGTAPSDALDERPLGSEASGSPKSSDAIIARASSPSTQATGERGGAFAQTDAPTNLADWIVQFAASVEPLCDGCQTSTAQSVALWLTDPTQASEVGAASTREREMQTLSRSLALIAEGSRSTGITPTTATLSASFGSARFATANDTGAISSEPDRVRFRYQSKSSRAERNAGLEGFEERLAQSGMGGDMPTDDQGRDRDRFKTVTRNHHPTVKPVSLMRWLVRLVTPPGGLVLDPFTGSGTTGIAAALEGFEFMGCEQDAEYAKIAEARIAWWAEHGEDALRIVAEREAAEAEREGHRQLGQLELL